MSVKSHPDYSVGYFDGLHDRCRNCEGREYRAGYDAGYEARGVFLSNGFAPQPDGYFSQTFTINGRAAQGERGQ